MTQPHPQNTSQTGTIVSLSPAQTWAEMREEAKTAAAEEPVLASFLNATILNHETFRAALSYRLAQKIHDAEMNALQLHEVCEAAYKDKPALVESALLDLLAYVDRDPACALHLQPFLYFKGWQAVQGQRIANWLWGQGRKTLAWYLQSRISELFGVDIHPATVLGHGLFIDHATGVVIGETARVGNNVSLLHSVTLGGTGKQMEDRHPKIADGVLIGAGAKVLGNIPIGEGAKIASGSVVLSEVKPYCTVAGVPAKVVGECGKPASEEMDQGIGILGPDN